MHQKCMLCRHACGPGCICLWCGTAFLKATVLSVTFSARTWQLNSPLRHLLLGGAPEAPAAGMYPARCVFGWYTATVWMQPQWAVHVFYLLWFCKAGFATRTKLNPQHSPSMRQPQHQQCTAARCMAVQLDAFMWQHWCVSPSLQVRGMWRVLLEMFGHGCCLMPKHSGQELQPSQSPTQSVLKEVEVHTVMFVRLILRIILQLARSLCRIFHS